ncbi:MAG: hypothetical protein ACRD0H_14480, partial [Actinomycetes bacterium]
MTAASQGRAEAPRGTMIDQRHISGATTGTIVRWVETVAGPEAVGRLLETAGDTRPVSQLLDETGWSS